jgi:monoamine oxidase
MSYATQDGTSLSESFFDNIMNRIETLYDATSVEADSLTRATDKSLQSILDRRFEDLLRSLQLNTTATAWVRAIYNERLKEEKYDTACGDLNELSALGWNSFSDSGGDQNINLRNGYISLINHFKSIVTDSRIVLNQAVLQIQYPSTSAVTGNPVKIITVNTITGMQSVYEADYVLSTMPLGYLKSYYKTLFSPPLPAVKVNAIENLGYGTVNKYWLVFDSPPFGVNGQGLRVLWRNDVSFQLDSVVRCGYWVRRVFNFILISSFCYFF